MQVSYVCMNLTKIAMVEQFLAKLQTQNVFEILPSVLMQCYMHERTDRRISA
jgi:hypothetical protein